MQILWDILSSGASDSAWNKVNDRSFNNSLIEERI